MRDNDALTDVDGTYDFGELMNPFESEN